MGDNWDTRIPKVEIKEFKSSFPPRGKNVKECWNIFVDGQNRLSVTSKAEAEKWKKEFIESCKKSNKIGYKRMNSSFEAGRQRAMNAIRERVGNSFAILLKGAAGASTYVGENGPVQRSSSIYGAGLKDRQQGNIKTWATRAGAEKALAEYTSKFGWPSARVVEV